MIEITSHFPETKLGDAELSRRERIATELTTGDVRGVKSTEQFLVRWGSLK